MKNLKIEDLSIEQKLGLTLCARRFTPEDMDFTLELIKNHALGCFQMAFNDQTADVIKKLRDAADYPLLIINDMEQGFPLCDKPKIPLMTLSACRNPEYYRAFAKGIVTEAKKYGFSGTWGPVLDLTPVDSPCKVNRTVGDDPEYVAEAVEEIYRIFHENKFLCAGKHYPGGSDCSLDTHMAEGFSDRTEEELLAFDLKPYIHLLKKGLLPAIMTLHSTFRNIDPNNPATFSKKVLDIIRRQGFDGVMFTDSLAMMGILQKYGEENIIGLALAAGNDIVLPNYRTPTKTCYEMLLKNYRDGMFTEERLNEAVRRVLAAQDFFSQTVENPAEFTEDDKIALESITRDCITAVTDDNVKPYISNDENKKRLFIVLTDNNFNPNSPEAEFTIGKWYYPEKIAEKIKEEFPDASVAFLPEFATAGQNDIVLTEATKHEEVIFVTFCTTAAYLGTDGLTRRTENLINALSLSGKVSSLVHFGNPFALRYLNHIPRIIFGYSAQDSQKYAIEVLSGKIEPKGTLPFNIHLN